MKNYFYISLLIISSLYSLESKAQSIPVGMSILEDYYRRAQLVGKIEDFSTFSSRPIFPEYFVAGDVFDPDSSVAINRTANFDGKWTFLKDKAKLQLLPLSMLNQINSHHPEGINDGPMIPARGFQTLLSAGVFFKFGPLSIQLRPEFVYAQNKEFDGYPKNFTSQIGIVFPNSPYDGTDFLERFGTDPYSKAFWGQSSIRLTYKGVSVGVSNENLWWGPGYRNTLLMTNSASGFKHVTLNTVKPINTPIGSFEGQLIGGKLENSGFTEILSDDWRYMNAIVLTYHPKWVPGLYLGMNRAFVILRNGMGNKLGDYLPVISLFTKSSIGTEEEVNAQGQNQLISVFMHWVFKEAHGEIYFEYGREDHSWDLRDFFREPSHSAAYLLGFRKLYSLNEQKETFLQFIVETTHLAASRTTINRQRYTGEIYASSWYKHGGSLSYTNEGQMLGAGIGPGSNLQTFDISWVKSIKQIGIQVERYVHNDDFWFNEIKDIRSNWVDIGLTAYANWDYKNLLFTLKLKYIRSYNYQWIYEPQSNENPTFWDPSDNTSNFHGQVGIMYRF